MGTNGSSRCKSSYGIYVRIKVKKIKIKKNLSYKHLKILRLWKIGASDEGVRTICAYMHKVKTLEYLDLLDNEVGLLGNTIKYIKNRM